MKTFRSALTLLLLVLALSLKAQSRPEQLLPADTFVLMTIPDWSNFRDKGAASNFGSLLKDPAMKPFREKFLSRFHADVTEPIEKELGVKLSEYTGLLSGQITLAFAAPGEKPGQTNAVPAILLIDVKDKSSQLTKNLEALQKKWRDSGKPVRKETIRGVEFSSVTFNSGDFSSFIGKVFPERQPKKTNRADTNSTPTTILIGQSGSLLVVGSQAPLIEQVLARRAGSTSGGLDQVEAFSQQARLFRDAPAYAWINPQYVVKELEKGAKASEPSANPLAPSPQVILEAIGLKGLKSIAAAYQQASEGAYFRVNLSVPESQKEGLFRLLQLEKKEASPLPFIPEDVLKYSRTRLDMARAWNMLEGIIGSISPQAVGAFNFVFQTAGKDQDPNFDLRRELFGNLGDDLVSVTRKPTSTTVQTLREPPILTLISSPAPEKLANAIKVVITSLGQRNAIEEREFLGKKVFSVNNPQAAAAAGGAARKLHFVAHAGYLAFSADPAFLEEFVRSSEASKQLKNFPALAQAADKVGGMNNGFFAFNNDKENARLTFAAVKTPGADLEKILSLPIGQRTTTLKDWIDPALLPGFDQVSKYFTLSVYSLETTSQGIQFQSFVPRRDEMGRELR